MRILFTFIVILFAQSFYAQSIAINNTGAPPDPSSMLDVKSENKGVLIP